MMKVGSPAGELLFVSILKNAKRRWQRIRKYGKHSSDASAFERDASRHGGGCGGVRSKRSWWQKVCDWWNDAPVKPYVKVRNLSDPFGDKNYEGGTHKCIEGGVKISF